MKLFELTNTVFLKTDLHFKQMPQTLAKYIDYSLCQDEHFAALHKSRDFKHYSFGGLYTQKMVPGGSYAQGTTATFTLRCFDEKLATYLQTALRENINNPHLIVIQSRKKHVPQFFISELYTPTPTIVTSGNDDKDRPLYWTLESDGDIMKLQKQLHDNAAKKYQSFFGEKLEEKQNFIQLLELKNKVPQNIHLNKDGKGVRLFGNKFKIVPNEDETSQKLAFTAMACGLGEKNSFGGGFCLGKGLG